MVPDIGEYGFLSDCQSAALVSRNGSVDWWCVPRFDSPSVFGRLLGPDAGHWSLHPAEPYETSRGYLEDSLVLRTVFRTSTGEVAVTDALATEPGTAGHQVGRNSPHILLRTVEGLRGSVGLVTDFAPRMEYGLTVPHLARRPDGVRARGGPAALLLTAPVPLDHQPGRATARFAVRAGDRLDFRLAYRRTSTLASPGHPDRDSLLPTVEDTTRAWRSLAAMHHTYDGPYRDAVRRSALVLQGLTYQPSGTVLAAATTSLPEQPGGDLNFDYRFAWLRDLGLTVRALWVAACPDEAGRLFRWISDAAGHLDGSHIQIMYGAEGERDLTEHELEYLPGFGGGGPVRVGNAAWRQEQRDVTGEVLDAAYQLRDQVGEPEPAVTDLLVALADQAAATWEDPDAGMWETRDQHRHYVSSKVMCWVALDRAVALAPRLGGGARPESWAKVRDRIQDEILAKGWNDETGAYTGAFGSTELDASILLMPIVGFLPATDDRMWATIEVIERELGENGLVRRWRDDPMGFLICTFWLVECLALGGAADRAREWFDRACGYAGDLGLMPEGGDPATGALRGNYPQAFSHVGLITAAWRLGQCS
ncbi:MAG TPA: glycoside hydrolase family 15 protein [Streptosporangiaceae bacterium]|nr:glycoside hydrolase family 15 protein [Streptosporangiaceae bacterium]